MSINKETQQQFIFTSMCRAMMEAVTFLEFYSLATETEVNRNDNVFQIHRILFQLTQVNPLPIFHLRSHELHAVPQHFAGTPLIRLFHARCEREH